MMPSDLFADLSGATASSIRELRLALLLHASWCPWFGRRKASCNVCGLGL